ncbi:Hybrid signal transduction histidine kinase J [Seminavis robusta]|uniref:Hybrid signal transduction histidine kinase J n=1 Tax=Seminavis robusta TaxID=568900 RepID=A0A9N8DTY0_9STRA|nr:Hybrid signal transduction histidine kinase J [Seminavis robusta]|eukprot:Sro369_g128120.1 Hybrid signal transduction histidine kinase J (808) ;mRNA; r:11562-14064
MALDLLAISHLLVAVANVVISLQFMTSLHRYPHRRNIPWRLTWCLILFAFYTFLSGCNQLLLGLGQAQTFLYAAIQYGNAVVSAITAVCLVPVIPDMFTLVDQTVSKLTQDSTESKAKLFTFMAFLCHEIRNPLFAITSSAECLQDTPMSAEQEEEVSSISDSSLLMLRLVNDVLDLSKLDSGKLEVESRAFDLHSMIKRLGDSMSRQVQRKHQGTVALVCSMSPSVPRMIKGDSVRILQIIYNLLSNSCKFTSEGTISLKVLARGIVESEEEEEQDTEHTVTMSANRPVSMFASKRGGVCHRKTPSQQGSKLDGTGSEEKPLFSMALLGGSDGSDEADATPCDCEDTDKRTVVLSVIVEDTGCGISHERLEDIFEPYTQAKLSDFRIHGGTGLGLSIISSLTKTMGGSISVTSKPGKGAKFHLRLPVGLPGNTECHSDESSHEDESTERMMMGESFRATGDKKHQRKKKLDYVGECLPSDQTQVPKQFLKCQRLPSCVDFSGLHQEVSDHTEQTSLHASGPLLALATPLPLPPLPPAPLVPLNDHSWRTVGSISDHCPTSPPMLQIPKTCKLPSFQLPSNDNVVLVVDDNSVNRKILGKMLSTYKIEHRVATNGQEAVDALLDSRNYEPNRNDVSRPRYSLVFMDISMPIMDGNTAISTIRQKNMDLPIVALSANVLSDERNRTIGLGADEYHSKPILRTTLHDICSRHLVPRPNLQVAPQHSKDCGARPTLAASPPTPTNTQPLQCRHDCSYDSNTSKVVAPSNRTVLKEASIASMSTGGDPKRPKLPDHSPLTQYPNYGTIIKT